VLNLHKKRDCLTRAHAIYSINNQEYSKLKSFTKNQLIDRAKQSNQDYLAGRIKSQEQLELESENW
jgi:hypothetical protein